MRRVSLQREEAASQVSRAVKSFSFLNKSQNKDFCGFFFSSPPLPPSCVFSSPLFLLLFLPPSLPVINCYTDEAQLSAADGTGRKSLTMWPDRNRTNRRLNSNRAISLCVNSAAATGGETSNRRGAKREKTPGATRTFKHGMHTSTPPFSSLGTNFPFNGN